MGNDDMADETTLASAIDDLAPPLRQNLRAGFANLDRLSEEQCNEVFSIVLNKMHMSTGEYGVSGEDLARELAIDEEEAEGLPFTVLFTATLGALPDADPNDFLKLAESENLLQSEHRQNAGLLFRIGRERSSELRDYVAVGQLYGKGLSNISGVEWVIDSRVAGDTDADTAVSAPVVILTIETDDDRSLQFEATPFQLKRLIADLEAIASKL